MNLNVIVNLSMMLSCSSKDLETISLISYLFISLLFQLRQHIFLLVKLLHKVC